MRSFIVLLALTVGCIPVFVFAANPPPARQDPSPEAQEPASPRQATEGEKADREASQNAPRSPEGDSTSAQKRKLRDAMNRYTTESLAASRGFSFLIESPAVRAELGIGNRQFDELLRVMFQRRIAEGEAMRARSERVRAGAAGPDMPSAQEIIAGFRAETDQVLLASLNPKQRRRLRQISLQARGPLAAFFDPDASEKLALQPKQIQKLRALLGNGVEDDNFPLRDPKTGKLPASPEEVDAAALGRQEGNLKKRDAALELLSERQRQVYDAAYGEPFNLQSLLPGPSATRPAEDAPQPEAGNPR